MFPTELVSSNLMLISNMHGISMGPGTFRFSLSTFIFTTLLFHPIVQKFIGLNQRSLKKFTVISFSF